MSNRLSNPPVAFAILISVLCLAGAGCSENRKTTSPQTETPPLLEGTSLFVQLPSRWELRKATSDDLLYFDPYERAWLAGPSDWLRSTTDTPREARPSFAGCTITQLPVGTFSSLEEWFHNNPIYSEEAMWFLGNTSTFQTDYFNQGIVASEGSPNATRTTSIYLNTTDGYITRISYFDSVDLDETQRKKLPEIASGCRTIASSLQTRR